MEDVTSARTIAVIGVSGSGKSTIACSLAQRLDFDFCEADDLHSPGNIDKMRRGQPLSDVDRIPWLRAVGRAILDARRNRHGIVVACSALRRDYRDIIREYDSSTYFVLLEGTQDLISSRIASRSHDFMSPSLLPSQFALLEELEEDERGQVSDVSRSVETIVDSIVHAVRRGD